MPQGINSLKSSDAYQNTVNRLKKNTECLTPYVKFYERLPEVLTSSKENIIQPMSPTERAVYALVFSTFVGAGTLAFQKRMNSRVIKNIIISYAVSGFVLLPDFYTQYIWNALLQQKQRN